MIEIDGSLGGGQLLRTALSLSTITEIPFQIANIRGSRPNPGLKTQHITAANLVGGICDADVEGAEIDSTTLTFRPGISRPELMDVDIGTAGSITLLFDTILPITMTLNEPFQLTAIGGTNVKWAPTIEYYRWVKLPLLAKCGLNAHVESVKSGFYPAGGGEAILRTTPAPLSALELERRGKLKRVDIYSKAATELAERKVADRQAKHAQERLDDAGYPTKIRSVDYVSTRSIGSSLLVRGVYKQSLVGFDSLGERGRTSEKVAYNAVRQFSAFHATNAPVDSYMADQVMTILTLVGGSVRIPSVTAHVQTNLEIINKFGSDMCLTRREDGEILLEASPHPVMQAYRKD